MTDTASTAIKTYSEIVNVSAAEIGSFAQPLPSEYYIRGSRDSISSDVVNKLKEDLTTRPSNGSMPVVQVNDPFTFVEIEGNRYWLNGNTRSRALIEMQNETKYSGFIFADVPVREYLGDTSLGAIRRLQVQSNDTTNPHTTAQLITAINLDYQYYIDQAPEDFSPTKKSSFAYEKLMEFYGLSRVRVGQYQKLSKSPEWFLNHINAGVLAVDVALEMVRAEEETQVPLQTIFHGCRSLLSEKEVKITAKHFKQFEKSHLLPSQGATTGETVEAGEGAEAGETAVTETKKIKTVDPEKATADILSVVSAFGSITSAEVPTDKVQDTMVSTVGSAAAVIGFLLGKQWIAPTKAVNAFDAIQDLLFGLLTNESGEIELPAGLAPEELTQLLKVFQPLGKQLELLTSVSEGDEVSDDEDLEDEDLEDEDLEDEDSDDSVDSDDLEDETEEYTIKTV